MIQQASRFGLTLLVLAAVGIGAAEAQYRYGASRGRGYTATGAQGVILFVEGGMFNPRNADNVVAVDTGGGGTTVVPLIPTWEEDLAGRVGAGYQWATGNSVVASYWTYEGDVQAAGSAVFGDALVFSIGPPVFDPGSGEFVGDEGSPGFFDVATELTAETGDLTFARNQALSDAFSMEWSAGLRYARFEETHLGTYDEAGSPVGANAFRAAKSLESEMFGMRLGARGAYRVGRASASASLAFSFLDGELTGASSLTPTGSSNDGLLASRAVIDDDGRSGTIRDVDVRLTWHAAGDRVQIWAGWEQSEWEDIAADLLREVAPSPASLAPRESVTFSGFKLGLRLRL